MAWVSLFNLLEPDKNLHGSVPMGATVKVRAGATDPKKSLSAMECLPLFKKVGVAELKGMDKKVMTLAEFCEQYNGWASNIEWIFDGDGHFVHFSDGLHDIKAINKDLKKKGAKPVSYPESEKYGFMIYCVLDLSDWLRQQPRRKLTQIARGVHFNDVERFCGKFMPRTSAALAAGASGRRRRR